MINRHISPARLLIPQVLESEIVVFQERTDVSGVPHWFLSFIIGSFDTATG